MHVENKLRKICSYDGQSIWASGENGSLAVTDFERVKTKGSVSLVRCKPVTGRTHQLRVHLSEAGFPILGDDHYARDKPFTVKAPRVMLHAAKLTFPHPETKQKVTYETELPDAFLSYC